MSAIHHPRILDRTRSRVSARFRTTRRESGGELLPSPMPVPDSPATSLPRPLSIDARRLAGWLAAAAAIALLALMLGGDGRQGGSTPAAAALPPPLEDFGGAEIDDGTLLQRNFGGSTDQVEQVVSGDMDGDGDLDLVVGRVGQDAVFLNDGAGRFDADDAEVPFNSSDGVDPDHFALGDLDGDGDLDAIGWWEGPTDRTNYLFVNDGSGDLGQRLIFPGGNSTIRDAAIADLDGDGALDVVLGRSFAGPRQNTIVLNANSGASPPSFLAEQNLGPGIDSTVALAAGDVDGDGDVDIAVANGGDSGDQVSAVYLNDGDGGFYAGGGSCTDPLDPFPVDQVRCLGELGHDTRDIALGDVDGDGDLDIVTANQPRPTVPGNPNSTPIDGDERLHKNDGTGHFDAGTAIGGADGDTTGLALADVDGDGRLDVVVSNDGLQNLVLYNDGGAGSGFGAADSVGPDGAPSLGLAVADVDGDGALDIAVGNDGAQSAVYLSPGALGYLAAPASTAGDSLDMTESLALGDIDRDGDLDLVAGNSPPFDFLSGYDPRSHVFFNNGSGGYGAPEPSFPAESEEVRAVAVADLDADGDLEVLVGVYGGQSHFVRPVFDETTAFWYFESGCPDYCFGGSSDATLSLATGDLDHDGDLDIVVGNDGEDAVYFNDEPVSLNLSAGADSVHAGAGTDSLDAIDADFSGVSHRFGGGKTTAVALGDLNGDSYLDLVVGNMDGQNAAYLNDGTGRFGATSAALHFGLVRDTRAVALGDMNGDGALDAVVGNEGEQSTIYLGDGSGKLGGTGRQIDFGTSAQRTRALALGDLNGDGALDIVVAGTLEPNVVFLSDGEDPPSFIRQRAFGHGGDTFSTSLALGDVNGDGTLDIVVGGQAEDDRQPPLYEPNPIHDRPSEVYLNRQRRPERLPDRLPYAHIERPGVTADGQGLSVANIVASEGIEVTYKLFDGDSDTVGRVQPWFSLDGGGTWRQAVTTNPDALINQTASPGGTVHTFRWDTFRSGFFGQSDEVVLRIEVFPQPPGAGAGSYDYPKNVSGPRQWPNGTTTTYPFRVRGTQVRVFSEDPQPENAVAGARVYRLPEGQTEGAFPLTNEAGEPLVTDAQGFLQGHAIIEFGDIVFALWPFAVTEHYTLYHTSGQITNGGLDDGTLEGLGEIPLIVSAGKPLMLFNLDMSLEWDARNDEAFMQQLRADIRRASEVLYDVTNGQVALGEVRIYQAKQAWLAADVIVHAANNLRPAAAAGGVVDDPTDDVLADSRVIEDAYVPGQIQMGPAWGRFGDPGDDLGDDWPRALAHELGHYFLFQLDNYLGLVGGRLVPNDCYGSFMTDAYFDEYSEFLARERWTGACLDTLAEKTTGRTDWETILKFYPWLNTDNVDLTGPSRLTLDVTEIEEIDPGTPATALDTPFYSLREGGAPLFVPSGGGQGYVFKNQQTGTLTDDYVIAVGSPVGDQLHARGAAPGDRLCIFDQSREPVRTGCVTVGDFEGTFNMAPAPGWKPQIQVSPVTTDTLAITVTQAIAGDLFAQVLPTTGLSTTFPITSTVAQLLPVSGEPDKYARTIQLPYPSFQAFVRVWEPGASPPHEAMTQFVLGDGWGPNRRSWGPNRRSWGPNRRSWGPNRRSWGAPVSSGNGQSTVYNLTDILGDTGTSALQSLTTRPPIPPWLEPVGDVLRFEASAVVERTIAINYLQQEVPGGKVYEPNLKIYFSADGGGQWQALDTILDSDHNLATATMPGGGADEGLYMLAATVTMPALGEGWNQFGYPIPGLDRAVAEALLSIADDYRLVYEHDPSSATPWRLFDQEVLAEHPEFADLVNDLDTLHFGGNYWIYALRATQIFFGLPVFPDAAGPEPQAPTGIDDAQMLPPATYYGPVSPAPGFTPGAGMTVLATVDGVTCGQASVVPWSGGLAYKVQVSATQPDLSPCGHDGATVVFSVDGQIMAESALWDNSHANYLPLGALAAAADLAVEQVALPDPAQAGRPFAYQVTVRNLGPLPATEIVLHGQPPAGAVLAFAADDMRYCQTSTGQVRCDLGAIPAGGTRTVVIVLTLPTAGTVMNEVTVTAFEPDPNAANNTSRLTHDVLAAILDNPTAVALRSFRVVVGPDGRHEISWSTGSEVDVMGFLIRRAARPEGPYQRVTPTVIPARGSATAGAVYRYMAPDAGPAYYRLETVALDGLPAIFGPVPTLPKNTRAYLPVSMQR